MNFISFLPYSITLEQCKRRITQIGDKNRRDVQIIYVNAPKITKNTDFASQNKPERDETSFEIRFKYLLDEECCDTSEIEKEFIFKRKKSYSWLFNLS